MIMKYKAGIIDVFADQPLEGNPLAVVEGADELSADQMRRIAGEFNQAETTFIMKSRKADRKLRSFTAAGAEVFGAGHNALGAWLWLAELGRLGPIDTPRSFRQEIGDVVLPIEIEALDGRMHGRMVQSPLSLLETLVDAGALADALGLAAGELIEDTPICAADTGAAHLMVRASSSEAVDRARPDADALLAVLDGTPAEGCYLYAFDGARPGQAYARFFNPTVGLWEDAATGTAAGPLSAYLHSLGMLPGASLSIEQGAKMGRRSILEVRLTPDAQLSGSGRIVFEGILTL